MQPGHVAGHLGRELPPATREWVRVVGPVYRCPLPTWQHRETHVVVRSGAAGLGHWHGESRDLHADYRACIGGPARSVVRVWLIANSLFLRGCGQCEYSDIGIRTPGGSRIAVL
ncbi:MAG: DUF3047 domain-containing protein [Steroidobacteraceae bacterium]